MGVCIRICFSILIVLGLFVQTALAAGVGKAGLIQSEIAGLKKGESGTVVKVLDGDSFVLDSGLRVELAAITAPKRANKRTESKAWPLADAAHRTLRELVHNKSVQLYYNKDRRDRYNRAQAQVFVLTDGHGAQWVQKTMVAQGLARVYPWRNDAKSSAELYLAERRARQAKRGIWASQKTNGFYDIRSPEPNSLAQLVDTVQIVEGIVVSTADVRGTIYLNFGADYKSDFTIAISKKNRRVFKKAGVDLLGLAGARVRVRGYIEMSNGPVIWLNTPARLEVLD